jgi:hypothetical protein
MDWIYPYIFAPPQKAIQLDFLPGYRFDGQDSHKYVPMAVSNHVYNSQVQNGSR